jgi:hypothetical protein
VAREGLAAVAGHLAYAGAMGMGLPEAVWRVVEHWDQPTVRAVWHDGWAPALLTLLTLACLRPLWARTAEGLATALAGLTLGLVALAPALSAQYLLWPVPFLALARPARAWRYSAAVVVPMLCLYLLFFPGALWDGFNSDWFFHHLPVMAWAGLNAALGAYLLWEWRQA